MDAEKKRVSHLFLLEARTCVVDDASCKSITKLFPIMNVLHKNS